MLCHILLARLCLWKIYFLPLSQNETPLVDKFFPENGRHLRTRMNKISSVFQPTTADESNSIANFPSPRGKLSCAYFLARRDYSRFCQCSNKVSSNEARNEHAGFFILAVKKKITRRISAIVGILPQATVYVKGQLPEIPLFHKGKSCVLCTRAEIPISWPILHVSSGKILLGSRTPVASGVPEFVYVRFARRTADNGEGGRLCIRLPVRVFRRIPRILKIREWKVSLMEDGGKFTAKSAYPGSVCCGAWRSYQGVPESKGPSGIPLENR